MVLLPHVQLSASRANHINNIVISYAPTITRFVCATKLTDLITVAPWMQKRQVMAIVRAGWCLCSCCQLVKRVWFILTSCFLLSAIPFTATLDCTDRTHTKINDVNVHLYFRKWSLVNKRLRKIFERLKGRRSCCFINNLLGTSGVFISKQTKLTDPVLKRNRRKRNDILLTKGCYLVILTNIREEDEK